MASAYKNVGVLVGSTGDVTVYTCPTATEAVVKVRALNKSEVFTFVDASHLISKANLWEEKDKIIAK